MKPQLFLRDVSLSGNQTGVTEIALTGLTLDMNELLCGGIRFHGAFPFLQGFVSKAVVVVHGKKDSAPIGFVNDAARKNIDKSVVDVLKTAFVLWGA